MDTVAQGFTPVTVASGTLALTRDSTIVQHFTGATAGQIVKLPDCTTLINDADAVTGWTYEFYNDASVSVAVQDNDGTALFSIKPGQRVELICVDVSDNAGQWTWQIADRTSLKMKSGVVAAGSFSTNPKRATVSFGEAFADTNYSVVLTAGDARLVTYESKGAGGFTINLNANQAPTAAVQWIAMYLGES